MTQEPPRREAGSYDVLSSIGGVTPPPRPAAITGIGAPMTSPTDPRETMFRQMREMQGPFGADQAMRQALMTIWRSLPEGSRSSETVIADARRLFERAVRDLAEDAGKYGFEG